MLLEKFPSFGFCLNVLISVRALLQFAIPKFFFQYFDQSPISVFNTFKQCFHTHSDVTMTPWKDEVDDNIGRVREVHYTIPLNAPFGPKSSQTVEKHSCYKQSEPGVLYVIDAECTPLGIPYADAFFVVNRYCLTRVSKDKCRLRVTSAVKYRKSVWGVVKSKYYTFLCKCKSSLFKCYN